MIFPIVRLLSCCMDLIFRILFLMPTLVIRIRMPLILTFFNTRDLLYSSYGLGLRRPPNQTDCDVTFSRSRDQWKITNDRKIIMDV